MKRIILPHVFLAAVFAAALLTSNGEAHAQKAAEAERVEESVVSYVEIFGAAIFFGSLNVEYPFTRTLGLRAGVSPLGVFPIMARYMTPGAPHRLEASLGILAARWGVYPATSLGYRYQPSGAGFVLRAAVDPLMMWGGLSFGYAF